MADRMIRIVIKILAYVFILLLLVYLFMEAKHLGYQIFADEAKDASDSAVEMILTVSEEENLIQIGKELARGGIVENPYIFAFALRCSEGYDKIQAGEYIVDSSQKPSEILGELIHKEEQNR
ncbi:MAG: hypothetical protein Q4D60_05520 [Eubacteriales bacterium]|nr:hypothetical protein [Eubacteriales bacterium]